MGAKGSEFRGQGSGIRTPRDCGRGERREFLVETMISENLQHVTIALPATPQEALFPKGRRFPHRTVVLAVHANGIVKPYPAGILIGVVGRGVCTIHSFALIPTQREVREPGSYVNVFHIPGETVRRQLDAIVIIGTTRRRKPLGRNRIENCRTAMIICRPVAGKPFNCPEGARFTQPRATPWGHWPGQNDIVGPTGQSFTLAQTTGTNKSCLACRTAVAHWLRAAATLHSQEERDNQRERNCRCATKSRIGFHIMLHWAAIAGSQRLPEYACCYLLPPGAVGSRLFVVVAILITQLRCLGDLFVHSTI